MIDDDDRLISDLQHQPDGQRLSTVIETVSTDSKVPIRLWTMVYSVLTVCLLSLLAGVTLAFPSPVLVELLQLDDPQFRFDTQLADIFGVRKHKFISQYGSVILNIYLYRQLLQWVISLVD